MNILTVSGNLGREWDTKYTQDGKAVASNALAIRRYDGSSFWLKVTIFGKRAETATQYSVKGDRFACSGQLDLQEYETKQGEKRTTAVLTVSDFDLPPRQGQKPAAAEQVERAFGADPKKTRKDYANTVADDDIPF